MFIEYIWYWQVYVDICHDSSTPKYVSLLFLLNHKLNTNLADFK